MSVADNPPRTYVGLPNLTSVPLPGVARCTFCGLAAQLSGADFVPAGISVFCPGDAAFLGFGDGTSWVEVQRKPRRTFRGGRRR